jgi:hypothetical protein
VGPAAPVIGVAAAREPGPGGAPHRALLEVQPSEEDEEKACTVRPRQRTSQDPVPRTAETHRPPAHTHLVDVWVHQDEIAALSRAG